MPFVQILIIKDGKVLLQRPLEAFKAEGYRMLMEADKKDATIGEFVAWVNFEKGGKG